MPIYFKCNLTMNNILQFSGFFLVALYFFLNLQKIADVGNFETLWKKHNRIYEVIYSRL